MFDKITQIHYQSDSTGSDLSCFKAELDLIAGLVGKPLPPMQIYKMGWPKMFDKMVIFYTSHNWQ